MHLLKLGSTLWNGTSHLAAPSMNQDFLQISQAVSIERYVHMATAQEVCIPRIRTDKQLPALPLVDPVVDISLA